MGFAAKYLAIVTPLAIIVDWYDIPMRISLAIQVALYAQPDAKIANGMYWTDFWLRLATALIS